MLSISTSDYINAGRDFEGVLKLVEIEVVPRVCYTLVITKNKQRGGTTMERMPHLVRERKKAKKLGEPKIIRKEAYEGLDIDTKLEMIRALIPIGIMAIYEELDQEVVKLAGARRSRR